MLKANFSSALPKNRKEDSMDLDALLEYCDADRDTVLKLHRFGMLWALPMDHRRKAPLRRALDQEFPEDTPTQTAIGIYHLAFRVAYGNYDLALLTKPLIPPRFSEAYNFLESPLDQRELLRERRPETYARLEKEAKLLQASGRYSFTPLDQIHQVNAEEVHQIKLFLQRELTPRQFEVVKMRYLEGMKQSDVAEALHISISYIRDLNHAAVKYLRYNRHNTLLETVFMTPQFRPRPNGATPPRQPPSP